MDRIDLLQLCHVRLGVDEPEATAKFASDVLGLERAAGRCGDVVFRSDHRAHTLALETGRGSSVGFEVEDEAALEAAAESLARNGYSCRPASAEECERRFVRRTLICSDASGNQVDLVLRPAVSGRRFFGSRDSGMTGLQCVGLRSTDLKRDLFFWTGILGASVSDWAGDVTYLRIDGAHHRIALYPASTNGILYITYGVESFDAVMQGYYFLQERQIRVLQGPGREAASGQMFVRFRDSAGHVFAYGYGMAEIDPARHRPRQFGAGPTALCAWGSQCSELPELAGGAL